MGASLTVHFPSRIEIEWWEFVSLVLCFFCFLDQVNHRPSLVIYNTKKGTPIYLLSLYLSSHKILHTEKRQKTKKTTHTHTQNTHTQNAKSNIIKFISKHYNTTTANNNNNNNNNKNKNSNNKNEIEIEQSLRKQI
jgi:hypothetical protein